jgi:hypothetical protein
MKRLLTIVFLRLYAVNLGRRRRSSAGTAYSDTMAIMGYVLVVPVFTLLLILVAVSGPGHLRVFFESKVLTFGSLFAVGIPLLYLINRHCREFVNTPDLADPYRSPRTRLISLAGVIIIPCVWVLIVGFWLWRYGQ